MIKRLLVLIAIVCSLCGFGDSSPDSPSINTLHNLVGIWNSNEVAYDLQGNLLEEIDAFVECKYVLDNNHISLIGYPDSAVDNLESSIWYISYSKQESLFYVRGLMPERAHMDVLKGTSEQDILIVKSDTLHSERGEFQFRFEIDHHLQDTIRVQAIWSNFKIDRVLRDEIWKRRTY